MRIVALEEHYAVPSLVQRIPQDLIAQRGFPPPGAPFGPASKMDELQDFGAPRLRSMDAGGVTMQVLSLAGPGADLLSPADGRPGRARPTTPWPAASPSTPIATPASPTCR
jgi:hypothetical protein